MYLVDSQSVDVEYKYAHRKWNSDSPKNVARHQSVVQGRRVLNDTTQGSAGGRSNNWSYNW